MAPVRRSDRSSARNSCTCFCSRTGSGASSTKRDTRGCSGARRTNVAPKMVSMRVVKTSISAAAPPPAGPRRAGRLDGKPDQRPRRAPDPVPLHGQHLGGPLVEPIDAVEQTVGVLGDAQEPLIEVARLDRRPAAPAPPVDHLLVGEHGSAVRAPVDRRPAPAGEAALEHPQEQPLVPPVVVGVARGQLALPGIADAEPLELPLHVGDVVAGPGLGVRPVLDGGVLGGKAEGVPTERMQDVEPPHPLHAGDDVPDHVVADVSDVGVPRRIGEHDEAVVLGAPRLLGHLEGALVGPAPLPLLLDGLRIVVGHGVQPGGMRVGPVRNGRFDTIIASRRRRDAAPARRKVRRAGSGGRNAMFLFSPPAPSPVRTRRGVQHGLLRRRLAGYRSSAMIDV